MSIQRPLLSPASPSLACRGLALLRNIFGAEKSFWDSQKHLTVPWEKHRHLAGASHGTSLPSSPRALRRMGLKIRQERHFYVQQPVCRTSSRRVHFLTAGTKAGEHRSQHRHRLRTRPLRAPGGGKGLEPRAWQRRGHQGHRPPRPRHPPKQDQGRSTLVLGHKATRKRGRWHGRPQPKILSCGWRGPEAPLAAGNLVGQGPQPTHQPRAPCTKSKI